MFTRNDSSDQRRSVRPTISSTLESGQGAIGTGRQSSEGGQQSATNQLPTISLPKGGGAIRGIGEKFAANPVTGTGSMTVPIATSPGRSGFGPQLSLSYDSGAGNGPFGFGWNLSLPSITRKTDKGLPQYRDSEESDVFVLSGAEDLVPVYRQDQAGNWVRDAKGDLVIHENERDGYLVRRYRPRIEGLFARIERWTNQQTGETHWRSISRDNITTLYGKTAARRITIIIGKHAILLNSRIGCSRRSSIMASMTPRQKATRKTQLGFGCDSFWSSFAGAQDKHLRNHRAHLGAGWDCG